MNTLVRFMGPLAIAVAMAAGASAAPAPADTTIVAARQRHSHAVHVGVTRVINANYWSGAASYINTDGHYHKVCAWLMLDRPWGADTYLTGGCAPAVRGVRHVNPRMYPCKYIRGHKVYVLIKGFYGTGPGSYETKESNRIPAQC